MSLKCPPGGNFKCDQEEDYPDEHIPYPFDKNLDETEPQPAQYSNTVYGLMLVPMIFVILVSCILVRLLLKGKKKYSYGASRSFSNPNYYSPNNEVNAPPNNGKFIWKRLKYDKSQVRYIIRSNRLQ